jgi:hypothetical protein
MKKQLIISAVALAAIATALVGHSRHNGGNRAHSVVKNIHSKVPGAPSPTTNVLTRVAGSVSGSISGPGGGSISKTSTITATSANFQGAVRGLATALSLPRNTFNSYSVGSVGKIAVLVKAGATASPNPEGGITLTSSDGNKTTFSPSEHQAAKAEAVSNAGGPGSVDGVGSIDGP